MRPVIRIVAALILAALAFTAAAQNYPSKPIIIVHGSKAGAPQDVMLRKLAHQMEKVAGVPVVVQPRPGGTGQVALAYLFGQPANGYTLFSDATGITSVLQLPQSSFKWQDLIPIYRIQLDPFALYVKRGGKFNTLKDLVTAMKKHPQQIRIGGYGTASPHEFTALAWAENAGVTFTWVPYNSGTAAIAAVMAGDLEAAMSNISVYSRFKEKTKVVAVSSAKRLKAFPDTPTFAEQNYPIVRYHWRGSFVKKGTPKEIVEKLHNIMREAVKSDAFQKYLANTSTLDGSMSQEQFKALLKKQAKSDRARLKALGMIKGKP